MICAIDMARNLRVPFEKRAKEIAAKVIGSPVESVIFSEGKVTCVYRDEYAHSEQEASFPVDWLFDPGWEEKHKAENDTKRRAWDERMRNYAEREQKQKDDRERTEYERLRTKFEEPKP
jgi:hypothetical protein